MTSVSASGGPMSDERIAEIELVAHSSFELRTINAIRDLLGEVTRCRAALTLHEEALEMACVELDHAKAKLGGWVSSPSREPADAHYLAEDFLARAALEAR